MMEFDGGSSEETYVVLTVEDIIGRIDDDINTICSALHVTRGEARILLTHFNWNVLQVTDAWFDHQHQVRKNLGLFPESAILDGQTSKEVNIFNCSICSGTYSRSKMESAECDHFFCKDCYKTYIESKIVDGHGCVTIKCLEPDCVAAVLDDMIERLVSDDLRERFDYYVVRSYIEGKRNIKWCPAPGCDYAIEFELGSGHYGVRCDCSYVFCWSCVGENNRAVDCETVVAWLSKNKDISADYVWVFANTKPCPKCKTPTDKDKGCMHMTCPEPCSHHFCWVCLGDWGQHNRGFYKCDVNKQKQNGGVDGDANKLKTGKLPERYYFKRWVINQCSREEAQEKMKEWENKKRAEVIEKFGKTELELEFITKAWLQIIECERVLKWTYTYALYMNEENKAKKELFEYLQGEAKMSLERLQKCAEKDLEDYLNGDGQNHNIKMRVIDLTKATNIFFRNLVTALENGLEEVNDDVGDGWDCYHCTYYNLNPGAEDCDMCALPRQLKDDVGDGWDCHHCTCYNLNPGAEDCDMCALPRQFVQQDSSEALR